VGAWATISPPSVPPSSASSPAPAVTGRDRWPATRWSAGGGSSTGWSWSSPGWSQSWPHPGQRDAAPARGPASPPPGHRHPGDRPGAGGGPGRRAGSGRLDRRRDSPPPGLRRRGDPRGVRSGFRGPRRGPLDPGAGDGDPPGGPGPRPGLRLAGLPPAGVVGRGAPPPPLGPGRRHRSRQPCHDLPGPPLEGARGRLAADPHRRGPSRPAACGRRLRHVPRLGSPSRPRHPSTA
jgi:hypothetical protein